MQNTAALKIFFEKLNQYADHWRSLVFLVILASMSLAYSYQEILFKRPQSVHYWRQADCASLALNYYQHGMNFFEPQTHNLTSNGGKSGNTCTSEVPLLYYSVAVLYHLFGYHEYIYRLLNTLLFFTGLFGLRRRNFLLVLGEPSIEAIWQLRRAAYLNLTQDTNHPAMALNTRFTEVSKYFHQQSYGMYFNE